MMHSRESIACDLTNHNPHYLQSIYLRPTTSHLRLSIEEHASPKMAYSVIQQSQGHPTTFEPPDNQTQIASSATPFQPHHVATTLNYYKDPGDGSEPHPSYVGKPDTYQRPSETLDVTVHDIRAHEDRYSLDKNGFQVYRHVSVEKDFVDEEQIKAQYYPETEQLLKDAYASQSPIPEALK
jgi:hypothetical protein